MPTLWSSFLSIWIEIHFLKLLLFRESKNWLNQWFRLGRAKVDHTLFYFCGVFACLWYFFFIFCSNIDWGVHIVGLGKIKVNHNFCEQNKTSISGNDSIYFYPDRVWNDSEHSVVPAEKGTSCKINHPLWQNAVNAHVNKGLKYSRKVNSFANSNRWVSIIPYFFLTGRKNSRTKSVLLALRSPNPFPHWSTSPNLEDNKVLLDTR